MSQLPYNPAKFIPTVQTTDTGAAGAGGTQAGAPSAAQTDTTAVSKLKAAPAAYVRTSGTGFTVRCAIRGRAACCCACNEYQYCQLAS